MPNVRRDEHIHPNLAGWQRRLALGAQVASYMADGKSADWIAEALNLSPMTAAIYASNFRRATATYQAAKPSRHSSGF